MSQTGFPTIILTQESSSGTLGEIEIVEGNILLLDSYGVGVVSPSQ